ncbi:MAG TPA: PIG-L family deacetylase [Acidimicrobiales bacterium]|nr:PIG-L family deacetylase [Acidimicrobiales bacterium]
MATAVFLHAHPDDEAIQTGGTMARMAADGHRVVLITATRGELGEVPDGLLASGETLAERRARELAASCDVLGVARHEYLGYGDSGMVGEPTNEDPACFWRADIDEAAARLAAILDDERADVLATYDENGGYGHPDHIQAHRVGLRAAEMAGTSRVFMATINRDYLLELAGRADEIGLPMPDEQRDFLHTLGVRGHRITTEVDVSGFLDRKRRAMEVHASQIGDTSFFLSMPPEAFAAVWGTEWYVRVGAVAPRGAAHLEDSLLGPAQG